MADDMTDKIKEILNNPEMMNMVSNIIASGSESGTSEENSTDLTASVKGVLNGLNNGNDKRINLLNALKPYMRDSRASNIDKAIRMIKLTKLSSIIKDL